MSATHSALRALVIAAAVTLTRAGHAQTSPTAVSSPPRIEWDPAWRRFDVADGIVTGVGLVAAVGALVLTPPSGRFARGGFGFDEDVRDVLRPSSRSARLFARDLSDFTLSISAAYPLLVDALVVASWRRQSPDVAREMILMNLEAASVAAGIQGMVAVLTGRERPYGRTCGSDVPAMSSDCLNSTRYRSFFSGHSAFAFTAAGVTCVHHARLHLYGDGGADTMACIAGLTVAAATATLRVVSDQHYATDVLVGAVVGLGAGVGVPLLLHYRKSGSSDGAPAAGLQMHMTPIPYGMSLGGTF